MQPYRAYEKRSMLKCSSSGILVPYPSHLTDALDQLLHHTSFPDPFETSAIIVKVNPILKFYILLYRYAAIGTFGANILSCCAAE